MKEELKKYLNALKIDEKKYIIKNIVILCIFLITLILIMFMFELSFGICILALGLCYILFSYIDLKEKYMQLINSKEIAFNMFYRYMISFFKNNIVLYEALKKSIEYVDDVLKEDITNLIYDIENDTSLAPFIKFSNCFNDELIKQMIILLYKTQEIGMINSTLENMNKCIIDLHENAINNYISKEKENMSKFSFVPLILTVVMVLIISFFIMKYIGGANYV